MTDNNNNNNNSNSNMPQGYITLSIMADTLVGLDLMTERCIQKVIKYTSLMLHQDVAELCKNWHIKPFLKVMVCARYCVELVNIAAIKFYFRCLELA